MAKDIGKHFRKILAGRHVSSVQTDISRLRLTDLAEKKRKNQLKQILVKNPIDRNEQTSIGLLDRCCKRNTWVQSRLQQDPPDRHGQ